MDHTGIFYACSCSPALSPFSLILRFFSLVDYNLLIYMRPLHTRMPQGLPGYGLRAQGYGLWVTRPEGTLPEG